MTAKYNSKNYLKTTDCKKGRLISAKLDDNSITSLEDAIDILEKETGLRYSRDILLRRCINNYCHFIRKLIQAGNHRRIDKEDKILGRISGREPDEINFLRFRHKS